MESLTCEPILRAEAGEATDLLTDIWQAGPLNAVLLPFEVLCPTLAATLQEIDEIEKVWKRFARMVPVMSFQLQG